MMIKLAIVTVLYKSENVLEDFFKSIACQEFEDFKLFIIDNSPTTQSQKLVEKFAVQYHLTKKIQYIPSDGNIGVAAGNNVGIEAALKEDFNYILLTNNDILITDQDLLKNMINESEIKNYKILIPKIYYYDTKEIWFLNGSFNKFRARSFHRNNNQIDSGQFNFINQCDYAPTCFMLFQKTVFEKVGLMDEKYFVYYDDTDFLWRCNLQNIKVNIFTKGIIQHKEGKSTGGNTSDFSFYYYTRNRFYFASKINLNPFIKYLSFGYIFAVSLLRSFKHKKTRIFLNIIKEFYNKEEFKRQNTF